MLLPTTLCLTAAALIINFWLGMRIAGLRQAKGISVGDGGDELLGRRMRAQLNFVEQVPLTLLMIGLIEIAGKGGAWLAPAGGVFMLGRIAHAIGMDGNFKQGRPIGMFLGLFLHIALVVVAIMAALGKL